MTETQQPSLQERYFAVLLDKVQQDRFPSATMLNMLEERMTEAERQQLVDTLLEKVAADRFPSIPMLRRIARLAS